MTRIICLANSWKHGERCIAGIDVTTGQWVRPVTNSSNGNVPKSIRLIGRTEPVLRDLLDIPLAATGPDFDFESENRLILPGPWRRVGQIAPEDLRQFCSQERAILHNSSPYVLVPALQTLPFLERTTLQLVETTAFTCHRDTRYRWKGRLRTVQGAELDAPITDPAFAELLDRRYQPSGHCLVTVSLSIPWRPPGWTGSDPCWKLIAGVIELGTGQLPTSRELNMDDLPF